MPINLFFTIFQAMMSVKKNMYLEMTREHQQ